MALGADRRRVVTDVVRDGLAVTLAGVGVGAVVPLATVRLVRTLLFGVVPQDPLILAAAAASLVAVAVLACAVPAARAARVDPMIAIRTDIMAAMRTMAHELRHALRSLVRGKRISSVAIALFAVTIGVTTAIYAVVEAVMLRPISMRAPGRTVVDLAT